MPDQPADPIHYDMKIPPEPKHKDQQPGAENTHGEKESPVQQERNVKPDKGSE